MEFYWSEWCHEFWKKFPNITLSIRKYSYTWISKYNTILNMNVKLSNYLNAKFWLKISAHSLYDNNCISIVIFSSQFHFLINPNQFWVSFVKLMCGLQDFFFPPNSLISKNWQEKLVKVTLDNKNSQSVKKQRNLSKNK